MISQALRDPIPYRSMQLIGKKLLIILVIKPLPYYTA